jgi:hypothetical protein
VFKLVLHRCMPTTRPVLVQLVQLAALLALLMDASHAQLDILLLTMLLLLLLTLTSNVLSLALLELITLMVHVLLALSTVPHALQPLTAQRATPTPTFLTVLVQQLVVVTPLLSMLTANVRIAHLTVKLAF